MNMLRLLCLLATPGAAFGAMPLPVGHPPPAGADAVWMVAQAAERPGAGRAARTTREKSTFQWGLDPLLVEFGALPDSPLAESTATLRSQLFLAWQPERSWEFRLGARLDGDVQSGDRDYSRWRADLGETYVRWRGEDSRVTLGMQTIVWGRVDAVPLIDRVSRVDLRRFVLDDLADRRLPQPALRWEQTLGDFKLDAVLLPRYRGVKLPHEESVWSPVDASTGRIIGVQPNPAVAGLIRAAAQQQDDDGRGGAAVRLTHSAEPLDYGLTVARTRQPVPWFRLDPARLTVTAQQPMNTFIGADFELVTDSATWRSEFGWTDDVAMTLPSGQMHKASAIDWIGAVELFPGGGDTRLNLQLVAHSVRTDREVLELKRYYGINGEIETTFDQGRWKLGMRFASGFNVHDTYLAPKLSFLGWEPHEVYVTWRHFRGEARSFSGFYRDNSMLAVGLKTRF
jgi:hypothetical protein